ncbi:MAG TPA: hypothetical protein VNI20_04040 [Fimbriimonadaceae bacterium]|nr:hypothetical protein [Fimbriimonadaceae bacterium]
MSPVVLFTFLAVQPPAQPHFEVLDKIVIGGDGGWDCLEYDAASHRLFVSRSTHVMVVDVRSKKVVGDIPGTNGVHDIALVPSLNKGYTSDGRDNSVGVFDLKTLKVTKQIAVGTNPDVMCMDEGFGRLFVFNGRSNDASVIDTKTDTVVGTVKLDGKPEFGRSDGHGSVFVNLEDKSEIERIDVKSLTTKGTWALAPSEGPTGLAYDSKDGLLFSACGNQQMAISDPKAGKVVASVPIGNGPDGAAFDPGLGIAFSPNGRDGTLDVIGKDATGKWSVLQSVKTQPSARTMTLDPESHRAFLMSAEYSASSDPSSRRRSVVPGSAAIIVVAIRR